MGQPDSTRRAASGCKETQSGLVRFHPQHSVVPTGLGIKESECGVTEGSGVPLTITEMLETFENRTDPFDLHDVAHVARALRQRVEAFRSRSPDRDPSGVACEVHRLAKVAPLGAIFHQKLMDREGGVITENGSVEDDLDGRVVGHLYHATPQRR